MEAGNIPRHRTTFLTHIKKAPPILAFCHPSIGHESGSGYGRKHIFCKDQRRDQLRDTASRSARNSPCTMVGRQDARVVTPIDRLAASAGVSIRHSHPASSSTVT